MQLLKQNEAGHDPKFYTSLLSLQPTILTVSSHSLLNIPWEGFAWGFLPVRKTVCPPTSCITVSLYYKYYYLPWMWKLPVKTAHF